VSTTPTNAVGDVLRSRYVHHDDDVNDVSLGEDSAGCQRSCPAPPPSSARRLLVNDSKYRDHPLSTVAARCGSVRPHQGHSALAVASGHADIAISVGSHPWDYAPLKVIVEEAGGAYTDFDGGDRIDTGRIVATNSRLHEQVLRVLRGPGTSQTKSRYPRL
jgi:hypothetical protein